jgi:phosphatidylglycerol:prolipoprotein diacylglycerol transferase
MLYFGLVVGLVAQNYAAHMAGLEALTVFMVTLILLIPALAGARLLFVATNWEMYRHQPKRIWDHSEGGAAMYGGFPFALLVSIPLLYLFSLPFGRFWDVALIPFFIGQIFTKIGCLLNGCCGGRPTQSRFSLYLSDMNGHRKRRFPTQLFEAGWGTMVLLAVIFFWSRFPFDGAAFLLAAAGYGIGRFALEFLREDQEYRGGFALGRLWSAGTVVIALAVFFIML